MTIVYAIIVIVMEHAREVDMTQENRGGRGSRSIRWDLVNEATRRACTALEEYHQEHGLTVGELVQAGVQVAEVGVEYALQDVPEEYARLFRAGAVVTLGNKLGVDLPPPPGAGGTGGGDA